MMRTYPSLVLACAALLSIVACNRVNSESCQDCEPGPLTDTDTGIEEDTDVVDTDDVDTDTNEPVDTEPPDPYPGTIRIIAMGDAGTGSDKQIAVGEQIATYCARSDRPCDLVLYLGDNVYNSGVEAVDDDLWDTHFEIPYANVDLPFWAVLGNHDLGGDGLGLDLDPYKAQYQIDRSDVSTKWNMPSEFYQVPRSALPAGAPVDLFGLNTTDIFFTSVNLFSSGDQRNWLSGALSASPVPWKIAYGHHPYKSNGKHGNAGSYEGLSDSLDWLPGNAIVRGAEVETFFKDHVCGKADIYLSGHDHNRQWIGSDCGTVFVVSGAGAKTTDKERDDNSPAFENYSVPGFLWMELTSTTLTAYMVDMDGTEHGPYTHTK